MITLHHLNQSRSHRILWMLEELGLEYQIKHYKRDPQTKLAPPTLKKIFPLGKAPVITHEDQVVAESAVILEYLLDLKPEASLRPERGTKPYRRHLYWMHYAEGSLMPPLFLSLVFGTLGTSPAPLALRPIGKVISKGVHAAFLDAEIHNHAKYVDTELEKFPYFTGEQFGAADIQMSFPLEALEKRSGVDGLANIKRFLQAIRNRPAYQRALEIGGPALL